MNDNVVFFLTFKRDLQFLYQTLSLKEALALMKEHGYTAVPVIDNAGLYCGSVSEGDFLWYLLQHDQDPDILDNATVQDLIRPSFMPAVNINVSIDDLIATSLAQNYIPVVDDRNCFIGIVTRKSLLKHLGKQRKDILLQPLAAPKKPIQISVQPK